MYFLNISLLLISAVLHVRPSTTNISPKPWLYNTRKVNSLPNDHKNCFCYPDGQLPTVQQQLDTQNNGLERLVIYLYKNGVTNEIKMYTPNADKQMLIPDIPYDSGDGLVTVTNENIYTLIYNNPYMIKVYNDHIHALVPAVTDSSAIGLNAGEIENIYPNDDYYLNPNNNYNGNEYSLAKNILIANGPEGYVVNEPQIGSTIIPQNVIVEPYDYNKLIPEQYWMDNNYPYTKLDDPQAIPLNPQVTLVDPLAIPLNPQVTLVDPLAIPLNPQVTLVDPLAFPLNPQTTPGNSQIIVEDPVALPVIPQSSLYKLQATPINSQSFQPNSQDYPGNPQAIPGISQAVTVNPLAFPDTYVGGLDQHVVYTFQADPGSNKLPSSSQDIGGSSLNTQYVTFNIWFNQQMKRFQNVNLPNDIKTIDSNVLRILVQKTFYENNIYVSTDGVMTDANGMVIDVANLELRPLLLGETFNHQILQNAQTVIKLPKHLPYLEGILVTLVSPPKILGIIPLGKTYLPETAYPSQALAGLAANGSKIYVNSYGNGNAVATAKGPYTLAYTETFAGPTNYYAYSGVNGAPSSNPKIYSKSLPLTYPYLVDNNNPQLTENNYWSSGPHYTVSKLPYPTVNWNPSELGQTLGKRRKMTDAKIEHHYEPPLKNRKKGKGRQKPSGLKGNGPKELTTAEPFLTINSSESGRRFPAPSLTGVMKTLLYLLNDLPSRRGLNSTEGVDIVNESEIKNDGGAPDFRIIGGNAATGSGTPLSNKGRSGSTEYA